MGQILGLGLTHSPPTAAAVGDTASRIKRMMDGPLLPEQYRSSSSTPAAGGRLAPSTRPARRATLLPSGGLLAITRSRAERPRAGAAGGGLPGAWEDTGAPAGERLGGTGGGTRSVEKAV